MSVSERDAAGLLEDGTGRRTPARQIEATFGRPEQTYDLGRYPVLIWCQNLLRRLS